MSEEKLFGDLLTALRMERLKAARGDGDEEEAKKWTSEGVANALEVTRQTYSGWENDRHLPDPNQRRAIAKLFRLSDDERDALYRAAAQAPPIQEIEEPLIIDNLPFQRNPFFTGREEHLKQLHKQLQEMGTATVRPISISGLSGIGKTELALEYAHRYYPTVYRAVLWVDADMATIESSYANLAEILKLPERNEQKLDRRIQAVKVWLKTHTNWLLIMDNVDDLPLAESFLPAKPLGHVLFTTQSQIIGTTTTRDRQIDIEAMQPPEGLSLLLLRSRKLEDEIDADDRKASFQLVKLLGGHPLALDQAGAYIEDTGVLFTEYVQRYQKERRDLLNRREARVSKYSKHPMPVAATLMLSFNEACKQHPLATDILLFCAFLHPDAIPEELFQHDDRFKFGTTAFDEAFAALHGYSLIKRNAQDKIFSIHRLVQAVLIDDMSPDLQKQWRERVVRMLDAAFPVAKIENWSRCQGLLPHVLACETWTEDEFTPTEGSAILFYRASKYLCARMSFSEAETLLTRVLSVYKQYYGVIHPYTVSVMLDLASIYFYRRKYVQAEPLYKLALALREIRLGTDHPGNAYILLELAAIYIRQNKFGQAEPLLEKALFISEVRFGAEHPSTAGILHRLAWVNHRQGKYEQAELLYRRAISLMEKHLGAKESNIAGPLYGLAALLLDQGQHEQAEELYQRALSLEEQPFDATEPDIQKFISVRLNKDSTNYLLSLSAIYYNLL